MKLRQKLAVVLASAMVVTAVPVVTMAASSSYATKVVTTKDEGTVKTSLVINVKDEAETDKNQVLYLTIDGAEFNTGAYTTGQQITLGEGTGTIKSVSKSELVVDLGTKVDAAKYTIPVDAKNVGADEVTISVDGSGTQTIEDAKVVVAKRSESSATVKGDSAKTISGEGKEAVAKITVAEPFAGVLAGETFTISLDNSNYEFDQTVAQIADAVSGGKGYEGVEVKAITKDDEIDADKINVKLFDEQEIEITVGKNVSGTVGTIVVNGLTVECTDKKIQAEEISVTVAGDKVEEKSLTVAKVVDAEGTLKLDDKAIEVKAGQTKTVKVKFAETLKGNFTRGKVVEFKLDNGALAEVPTGTKAIYEDEDDTTSPIIGFEYEVKREDKINETFSLKLKPSIADEGTVTLTASGRAIGEDLTLEIATIVAPFEVKMESVMAEAGVKDQKGGKLVITEAAKGNISAGTFQITLEDGVEFSEKPEFEVTSGDLIIEKVEIDKTTKSTLNVTVKRASKTASTIEISNFGVRADRTLSNGSYEATVSGTALGNGKLELSKFLVVGAQDLTAEFTVGASTYKVNGAEKAMDGQAYVTAAGRTMVPVRYVSEALGVAQSDILFNKGVVTIFAGNRTVQLTNGSNVAIVNGVQIAMDEAVTIKENRTYVPMGEIARLLGVSVSWDNATKTATFAN